MFDSSVVTNSKSVEKHSKSCARDSKEVMRSISNEEKRGRKLDTFCEEKWVRASMLRGSMLRGIKLALVNIVIRKKN